MTRRIASLRGSAQQHRALNEPKYRSHITDQVYILDLSSTDLRQFDAVLVPCRTHFKKLAAASDQFAAYLENGGTVVSLGEQVQSWLPGVQWEFRPTNYWWWTEPNPDSGIRQALPDHSLFE